ncbi:MAG: hypothetical protein WDN69_15765 [Aliidongia sp.]
MAFRDDMGWRRIGRAFALGCGILALGTSVIRAAEAPVAVHPELWPALPPKLLIQPRVESFVDELLAQMTLEEKIGQMIQGRYRLDHSRRSPPLQTRFDPGRRLCRAGQ